jgi:hypothetical protein
MELYRKFVSKKTGAAPVTGKSIKVVEAERRPISNSFPLDIMADS